MNPSTEFMAAIINAFEANKRLADRAIEQVADEKLHVALDANTNSIAVIMKHVAGNLTSRWTDFLTTDGEKPGRNRDDEFIDTFHSRAEILAVAARLECFAAHAAEPNAGRSRPDGLHSRRATYRPTRHGPLARSHVLSHWPNRAARQNSRRRTLEHTDDPPRRLAAIQ